MKELKEFGQTLKETFIEWSASSAIRDASSLAYFAIFSIPGLLIIIIWIAGNFFGEEAIQGEITQQVSEIMGQKAASSIESLIASSLIDRDNILMKIVGILTMVFGATTLFFQLQKSLNELWEVKAVPNKAVKKYLIDRANSLGMILVIGFLLMITMVLSSMISLLNEFITSQLGMKTYVLMEVVNFGLGFILTTMVFAFLFKVLPDVEIEWKAIWSGALLTSVLFTLGKFVLSLYFSELKPTSAYGQAGTIILIMMWINYTCILIFFGAEFTRVRAKKRGYVIKPAKHATWSDAKLYQDAIRQKEKKT